MNKFQELGLAEPLLKALTETGYETPTPIQLQAIPPVLKGLDVLGIAQTGTGKTAAFALPILHRLAADRRPTPARGTRCLVLSPTRELATQIAESFRTYGKNLGFTVAVVFGGVSERPQTMQLNRGVDILVATPGRLLDHMSQRNVSLASTEVFVLDEADQMLDLGFFRPIRKVVAQLPAKRQNLFFSATMPKEIEELTRELLRDPVKVSVAPSATTVERVSQRVIHIEQNKKKSLLVELLSDKAMQRTLVFTRTKRGADRVAKHLVGAGVPVSAIHGNKSQNQREAALDAFKEGKIRVLCATDIAARGIDIDEVTHVVNFDLPEVPEAYVHRIGRTARAGTLGAALAFCSGEEKHLLRDIERLTRQVIPSDDRRNDATLLGEKAGEGGGRGERREGGRGGQRGGGGERSGNRAGQRHASGERPAFGDRPRFGGGERREGAEARPAGHRDGGRGYNPAAPRAPAQDRGNGGDRGESRDRPRGHGHRDGERSGVMNAGASASYGDRDDAGGHRSHGGERSRSGQARPGGHSDARPHGGERAGERPREGQHEPRRFAPGGDRGGDRRPGENRGGNRDSAGHRNGGERSGGGYRGGAGRPATGAPQGGRRDRQRPPHAGSKP